MSRESAPVKLTWQTNFLTAYQKLPKNIQSLTTKAIEQFQKDYAHPGLNFEELHGHKSIYSIRVNDDYRVILFYKDNVAVMLWVTNHDAAYEWAERHAVFFNPAQGSIGVVSINAEATAPVEKPKPAPQRKPEYAKPVFADRSEDELAQLGVYQDVMRAVRGVRNRSELDELSESLPPLTFDSLVFLLEGDSYDDVVELYKETAGETNAGDTSLDPARWDMDAFSKALESATSRQQFVTLEPDMALEDALAASLDSWRVFLHPTQRAIAYKSFNGSFRALGDAGTGKTVAALHRVKYLVENVFTEPDQKVLLTTFTRNLANDLKALLAKLVKPEDMKRVDVENISAWAARQVRKRGYEFNIDHDGKLSQRCWEKAFQNVGIGNYSEQFYKDEYALIILPQNIESFDQYRKASRVGRGKALSRKEKETIWRVFDEYIAQLRENRVKSYDDLYRDVAVMLSEREPRSYPYCAVVVDETQDFSLPAYKLLRAMVPVGANDIFLVGDARQRIYGYRSALSAAGINIRGRGHSAKLRNIYRSTRETYEFAMQIVSGDYDDIDGETDAATNCVALRSGKKPQIGLYDTAEEERRALAMLLRELAKQDADPDRGALSNVCLVARTQKLVDEYKAYIESQGLKAVEIDRDNSRLDLYEPGVRCATIHRVKGLEFDYVVVAGANADAIPNKATLDMCDSDDPTAKELAMQKERSLLYVALTRAKMTAFLTAHGELCSFIKEIPDRYYESIPR